MTDKQKLEKLKKLADAMYYEAHSLSTDASGLHKAMVEYHQFVINEYRKKEPTGKLKECIDNITEEGLEEASKQLEGLTKGCMYSKGNYTNADRLTLCKDCEETCIYNQKVAAESLGISQEEYEEIIDKCLFDDEPELLGADDLPSEEPVSEEFEKALAEEWKGYNERGAAMVDALEDNTQELAFAKGFYRGVNWQKQQDLKPDFKNALLYVAREEGVEIGKAEMREQMMAKAVDGVVREDSNGYLYVYAEVYRYNGFSRCDKVKAIIIKED